MHAYTTQLQKVIDSGRDDFDFHDPEAVSIHGAFAQHVKSVPLASLCLTISSGKTAARNAYVAAGVRIVKVKNVTGSGIRWGERFYVTREFFERAKKAHIQENDIVMLCSAHSKVYIGRCDIVHDLATHVPDGSCSAVGELIIIRANNKKVIPEYLLTYLRLPVVQAEISRMVKGQSAHLYSRDLKDLKVVVPSLAEQQEIATISMNAQREYRERISAATQAIEANRTRVEKLILQMKDAR